MKDAKNKNGELILSFDAGTQSIRATLVDTSGNIVQIVKRLIEPYFSENPGWAEQHTDYYWKTLGDAGRELMGRVDNRTREAIVAVTLTTQRATMINVDADGRPLRPACLWLDQRKADSQGMIPAMTKPFLKAMGLWERVDNAVQSCEANWIRQNQPDIWEKTHKYLLLSGFLPTG